MTSTARPLPDHEGARPDARPGVTFLVPVHGDGTTLAAALASVLAQGDGRPMEVIVVDDGWLREGAAALSQFGGQLRVVASEGRGAAAALNTGIRAARHSIVCQVDQDVVLQPRWMATLVAALSSPGVAAAQGYYCTDPRASLVARVMGRDLEQRYARMSGAETTHVCTGNVAYRKEALLDVGLFDESLGYGYDNDMSYRLRRAGYRLVFCPEARSVHLWRTRVSGYLRQQYGFGYGRLDVVAKHPGRVVGDTVSPALMMAHPVVLAGGLAVAAVALILWAVGRSWTTAAWAAAGVFLALVVERGVAGVRAARRFRDTAPLLFPVVHLARDAAWIAASGVWILRRLARRPGRPWHSMRREAGVDPGTPGEIRS